MLRFTIRDLLWLTALAAVLVAWGIDRARTQENLREIEAVKRLLDQVRVESNWAHRQAHNARQQQATILREAARQGIKLPGAETNDTHPSSLQADE